ncbi:unnamed protein product [Vitrella brassicaformis CCMP3155]|uniref:Ubiquitin carboxyl-terminal hydrolase n=1 Tax=Vitrella brassicaformis (strain CCMP3155) TaxID=1169540 RepID=A0A0G4GVA9_VITBC|nr:unnamed protein product [Vitrella brassicaformis CCMP3155]|mmetsp:Transcript_38274/g.95869  ORF Transcript_38274/g.95869 Transcript_38274/m.95869 type:complete len:386 (-) Transcript_38274:514-1671(-)|eukprot:CEM34803.1 unnamed protein product [Vitrella brassicaformis CCMP3155]
MEGPNSWCTIESDPGVFTELVQKIGVKDLQFEEVYSLDDTAFTDLSLSQVYGLIFLFKWRQERDPRPVVNFPDRDLFFAKQEVTNACATQAILSVLLNRPEIDVGTELTEFKHFTKDFDAQTKGLAIGNSEVLRREHNSFHKVSSFEFVQDKDDEKEDAFHFISYVPFKGKIYELDGLKPGPIEVGEGTEDDWLEKVRPEIQRRIDKYQSSPRAGEGDEGEIRFNLLAIVGDRKKEALKAIDKQRVIRQRVRVKLISFDQEVDLDDEVDEDSAPPGCPTIEDLPTDIEALKQAEKSCTSEIERLQAVVADEEQKFKKWERENARRRHDFVPFVLCALRHLARKNMLRDAFAKGKEAFKEQRERAKKQKTDKDHTMKDAAETAAKE